MIDFGNVQTLKTKNERKGGSGGSRKGQNYNGIRYVTNSKGDTKFTCSNALFEKMGFEEKGFGTGVFNGKAYLFLVPDTAEFSNMAVFLKKSGKSKAGNKTLTFNSSKLEEQLSSVGLISKVDVASLDLTGKQTHKQYVNISDNDVKSEFGDTLPSEIEAVYEFVSDSESNDDSDVDETPEPKQEAVPNTGTPTPEPAMAEEGSNDADADDSDW